MHNRPQWGQTLSTPRLWVQSQRALSPFRINFVLCGPTRGYLWLLINSFCKYLLSSWKGWDAPAQPIAPVGDGRQPWEPVHTRRGWHSTRGSESLANRRRLASAPDGICALPSVAPPFLCSQSREPQTDQGGTTGVEFLAISKSPGSVVPSTSHQPFVNGATGVTQVLAGAQPGPTLPPPSARPAGLGLCRRHGKS